LLHPLHLAPIHASAPAGGSWFFTVLCAAIFAVATAWRFHAQCGVTRPAAGARGRPRCEPDRGDARQPRLLWFYTDNKRSCSTCSGDRCRCSWCSATASTSARSPTTRCSRSSAARVRATVGDLLVRVGVRSRCRVDRKRGRAVPLLRSTAVQHLGIPLWWMFCNPVLPIVAGSLFFLMRERLRGPRAC